MHSVYYTISCYHNMIIKTVDQMVILSLPVFVAFLRFSGMAVYVHNTTHMAMYDR